MFSFLYWLPESKTRNRSSLLQVSDSLEPKSGSSQETESHIDFYTCSATWTQARAGRALYKPKDLPTSKVPILKDLTQDCLNGSSQSPVTLLPEVLFWPPQVPGILIVHRQTCR